MTAAQSALRPAFFRVLLALAVVLSVGGFAQIASAPSASAYFSAARGATAVRVAATRKGAPYRWGAVGPRAFDCSGLVQWTFKRVGRNLPRTSSAQYRYSQHISRAQARPGDLVFFFSGRRVYHVGIYAGRGLMWHAPHRGDRVRLARIYSSHVRFGRAR